MFYTDTLVLVGLIVYNYRLTTFGAEDYFFIKRG